MGHVPMAIMVGATALLFGNGCDEGGPPRGGAASGPVVAVNVAALNLAGVGDVVWDLEVTNGRTPTPDVVWQRRVSSSGYGDGAGSASYVGPCDADPAVRTNTVKVWVVGVYSGPITALGSFASGAPNGATGPALSFQNPTATAPLTRSVVCADNADVAVQFDVALMRPAQQGFFDIAVSFNDIFCSAKLDCCDDANGDGCTPAEEIRLLFDAAGARGRTFVLGFACTAGTASGVETALWLDPLVLDCDVNSNGATVAADITIHPAAAGGLGNQCAAGSLSGCAAITEVGVADADTWLYQVAVYRGVEALASGGAEAHKLYWNVALGVKPAISACTLHTAGTAEDAADPEDLVTGGVIAAGAVYPYVRWAVPLGASCASEPLTFATPGASVTTLYTGTAAGATAFAYGFAPSVPPVVAGSAVRAAAGETSFVVPAGVTTLTAKLWGGGGAGAGAYGVGTPQGLNGYGGAGGYASCPIAVTPGETLTVRVGGGGTVGTFSGVSNGTGGYNGGAPGYNTHSNVAGGSGPGGGASEVLRGATPLCVAGGGGGGGYSYPPEVISTGYGRGGGGGQQGEMGRGNNGTNTPGGAAGGEPDKSGSPGGAIGGNAYGGGGGGGGYRGGTGGLAGTGGNGGIGCGGGGGSSYAPGGTIVNAVYDQVPNTADPDYASGAAAGGAASQTAPTSGAAGRVILRWGP